MSWLWAVGEEQLAGAFDLVCSSSLIAHSQFTFKNILFSFDNKVKNNENFCKYTICLQEFLL
jgi:hypothetical protein